MTIRANDPGNQAPLSAPAESPVRRDGRRDGRKPYQAPRMKRLGSVREVTWGAGSGIEGFVKGMGKM